MKKLFDWNRLFRTKTFWMGKIQNDLYGQVDLYLKRTGKSKQEFAADLGVSKGYVSQVLNGEFDHKLSKLIELYLAIGRVPLIYSADVNAYSQSLLNGKSQDEFVMESCLKVRPKPELRILSAQGTATANLGTATANFKLKKDYAFSSMVYHGESYAQQIAN